MVSLRFAGVSHGFGRLPVLAALDLAVAPGEVVAILGPSGCGKTTLLRLAAGLLAPASGRIERPSRVGMAFQEPRLLPWRDCLGNVLFGVDGPVTAAHRARAGELLAALGLLGFESYRPAALSGGMAHRVSLARALIGRPELLLLDEPLAGMDYFGRTDLEERLASLWREEQPAVLLVTHDPDEALYLADRILILSPRPGRIVAEQRVAAARPRDRLAPDAAAARAVLLAALRRARESSAPDPGDAISTSQP
ncbi:MAG: ATP-binding cassette domain-containing protein [Patescibacteria group bacterium]